MLNSVAADLKLKGFGLWVETQVEVSELKKCYKLDELYFARKDGQVVGLVFLQEHDDKFWLEMMVGESLFFHKLAVLPEFRGRDLGYEIIERIVEDAINRGLDCDNRPQLRRFYERYGFEMVDQKIIDTFNVVRYQLSTRHSRRSGA